MKVGCFRPESRCVRHRRNRDVHALTWYQSGHNPEPVTKNFGRAISEGPRAEVICVDSVVHHDNRRMWKAFERTSCYIRDCDFG